MKGIIGKIALFLVTLLLCLVAAEFIFRWMIFGNNPSFDKIRKPDYYAETYLEKDITLLLDDYWKLAYYFHTDMNPPEHPHPFLGWIGYFNFLTLEHNEAKNVGKKRPVLLYGDSFAQCVKQTTCFQDILNSDSVFSKDHYLLNYGVGGYGVCQMSLLMDSTIGKFKNPFVILSIMPRDVDRTILSFRIGQKPYYNIENEKLTLKGLPIESDSKKWIQDNPPTIKSYMARRLLFSDYSKLKNNPIGLKKVKNEIIAVNEKLITQTITKLQSNKTEYVVLLFNTLYEDGEDWRNDFLYQLMNKLNAPYIIAEDLVHSSEIPQDTLCKKYILKGDGHPNEAYYRVVCTEIQKYLFDTTNYAQSVLKSNQENYHQKRINYFIRQMNGNPEWLKSIKEKAMSQNKPLDEVKQNEAAYFFDEYLKKNGLYNL